MRKWDAGHSVSLQHGFPEIKYAWNLPITQTAFKQLTLDSGHTNIKFSEEVKNENLNTTYKNFVMISRYLNFS